VSAVRVRPGTRVAGKSRPGSSRPGGGSRPGQKPRIAAPRLGVRPAVTTGSRRGAPVYLRARYYDPATGQFLTRDPLQALTKQPYAYVDDDPLNATDPLGLCHGFWGCTFHYVGEGAEYTGIGLAGAAAVVSVVATDGADAPLLAGGAADLFGGTEAAGSLASGLSAASTAASGTQALFQCLGIITHDETAANCAADAGSTAFGAGAQFGLGGLGFVGAERALGGAIASGAGDAFSDGPWPFLGNATQPGSGSLSSCEQEQIDRSLWQLLVAPVYGQ
jgi:RHS repeat-associated protein